MLSRLASALGGNKKEDEAPKRKGPLKTKAQARLEAEARARKGGAAAAPRCPKCRAAVSKGSRRCMRCGCVMQTAADQPAEASAGAAGGYRELSALTPLQVQILVALSQVRSGESVCNVFRDDPARVTVHDLTFDGDKALQAVGMLQDSGYLTRRDSQSFTLSMIGKHLAELALTSPPGRSA